MLRLEKKKIATITLWGGRTDFEQDFLLVG